MARRSGGTHKGVEEKRRSLPIYEHYTLSPGKTKSHHPEAKCNHCHKEFVCGSKQRLIRHLRKCNNISNPELIIAETLNTLARNSATGQLNHSILEASNLLPSQIQQHHHHTQQQQHQIIGQQQQIHSSPTSSTTTTITNNVINGNNNTSNHNNSGSSSNDTGLIASSSNGSSQQNHLINSMSIPIKRPQKRGRKPTNHTLASSSPTIHVTTGLDGKTHFTPATQLPPNVTGAIGAPITIGQVHATARPIGYTFHPTNVSTTSGVPPSGALNASLPTNSVSGHVACATTNHHHHTTGYKFNSEPIDKAYLKLVLTRNLPLSLSDTKEFQLWIKTLANDYKPPNSINLITHNLKNEAQAAKQRISNILVKAFKKTINLELHSWPDDNLRGHLWYALIANIDLKRFLISVKDVKQHDSININSNNSVTSTTTSLANANSNTANSLQQLRSTTNTSANDLITTTSTVKILSVFIDECIKRVGSDRINSLVYSEFDELSAQASQNLYANHPSIVTYQCWWHFTNLLCSDIIKSNRTFEDVMRKSNVLINFINKRPSLNQNLEQFNPFTGIGSSVVAKKTDHRWYSHLVCYLLKYIENNNEAIIRALEAYSTQSRHRSSSDNNNNSSSGTSMNTENVIQQQQNTSTQEQQSQQFLSCHEDSQLNEIESIVTSNDYWSNLNFALVYLKPIQDIVALTSTVSNQSKNNTNNGITVTPAASPTIANSICLSNYMSWFLEYGKILINSWRENQDNYKYQLIKKYFDRFSSTISSFKLLLAAYLLNPKYRCAYMTQKAKDTAIEEILNIASEFMPEESDGHTIFDQWKLYLVRDEPYDVVYDENRISPLEWWMSLPCAESIRRVALRILRLKSFASPKPETLFSQLYFYEDETKSSLNGATFEDIAVLRYFYDFEDKIGQTMVSSLHNHSNTANNSSSNHSIGFINGYHDRTQVGQIHNNHLNQTNYSTKYLPSGALNSNNEHNFNNSITNCNNNTNNNNNSSSSNGPVNNRSPLGVNGQVISDPATLSVNDNLNRQGYNDSTFSDVIVDSYLNHHQEHLQSHQHHLTLEAQSNNIDGVTNPTIEDLAGYKLFTQYIDYSQMGVQIVEEPIEKKKRKWTAQEILSKCQSNHQNNNNNGSNNNNNNNINSK